MATGANYLVLTVIAWWLVRQGLVRKGGSFLSWPMFNDVSFFRVTLYSDASGQKVNPYTYMVHIDYAGGVRALEEFLLFMVEVHGTMVSGRGVLIAGDRKYRLRIEHSVVDVA